MKRKLLLMLLCAALGLGAAQAEVYRVENEADVPADWAEKDTLRLTCIDTNRSDAMVLQSGGEAMMVDGGEGRYRKRVYATLDGYGITELKYLLNTHCDDSGQLRGADTAAGAVRPEPLRPQHEGDGGLGEEPYAGRGALLLRRRNDYDADRRHGLVYLARTELRRPAIRRGC